MFGCYRAGLAIGRYRKIRLKNKGRYNTRTCTHTLGKPREVVRNPKFVIAFTPMIVFQTIHARVVTGANGTMVKARNLWKLR